MLDHLSNRRFEFGTGRGAGSHEVADVQYPRPRCRPERVLRGAAEIVRNVGAEGLHSRGNTSSSTRPTTFMPSRTARAIPHMACGGQPGHVARGGRARHRRTRLYFLVDQGHGPLLDSYKQAVADCVDPVGQFKNDNAMITSGIRCSSIATRRANKQPSELTSSRWSRSITTRSRAIPAGGAAGRTRRLASPPTPRRDVAAGLRVGRYARGDLEDSSSPMSRPASINSASCAQRCQPRRGARDDRDFGSM